MYARTDKLCMKECMNTGWSGYSSLLLYLLSLSLYENTHTVRRITTPFLHYSHIMSQSLSNFEHSRWSLSNRASTLRVFKVQLHNSSFSNPVRIISVNFDRIRFCAKRPILIRSCPASMHLVRQFKKKVWKRWMFVKSDDGHLLNLSILDFWTWTWGPSINDFSNFHWSVVLWVKIPLLTSEVLGE